MDAFVYADCWVRERKRPDEFGYDLRVIVPKPGPIKTMTGLEIIATHGLEDVAEGLDTLIVAGGIGVVQACANPELVEWVKTMAPGVRRLAWVCTGAFLLAAAGLLTNRRVTNGFGTPERMRRSFQRYLHVSPQDYRARFHSALGK